MLASCPSPRGKLSAYHGRRVSVFLSPEICVSGPAHYEVDLLLGNVLKVLVGPLNDEDAASATWLLIRESEWSGLVVADLRQEGDDCFVPL